MFVIDTNWGKRLYASLGLGRIPLGDDMNYTRFEKARIIGARALQISCGAPVLVDGADEILDPIDIAMLEFSKDMIPITVVKN